MYIMDLQGSGLSPRPKMDDPCNANPAQRGLLETNPGTGTCSATATYAHQLGNSQSEGDELATVVKFIRGRCNNEKVAFIGWSAAAFVMGPYALQRQEPGRPRVAGHHGQRQHRQEVGRPDRGSTRRRHAVAQLLLVGLEHQHRAARLHARQRRAGVHRLRRPGQYSQHPGGAGAGAALLRSEALQGDPGRQEA